MEMDFGDFKKCPNSLTLTDGMYDEYSNTFTPGEDNSGVKVARICVPIDRFTYHENQELETRISTAKVELEDISDLAVSSNHSNENTN